MENKITEEEKWILETYYSHYKWIARDHSGKLYLYTDKPFKANDNKYIWTTDGDYEEFPLGDYLFPFIEFEDDEPYSIEELLKYAK